ncbi:unnamed protein product [Orchesella dallaii]|uniref:Chromo domain-containing protein n=1 Tax=Orchesella dallaii TaxID=48710 RepID=A0ABP1PTX1_9HEXA
MVEETASMTHQEEEEMENSVDPMFVTSDEDERVQEEDEVEEEDIEPPPKKGRSSAGAKKGSKKAVAKKSTTQSRSSSRPRKPVQRLEAEEKKEEEDKEFEVEKIIGVRTRRGAKEFQIKWKGYRKVTWEPEENLSCKDLIKQFKEKKEKDVYEVEKLLQVKTVKKQRQFLVKWKGFSKTNATWEPEENLDCKELIKAFDDEEEDEEDEYEVEKLLNVRTKKKGREFLVKWKGFGKKEATWEPEKNLSCKALIKAFQEEDEEEEEEEYEVDKIMNVRTRKNKREFLVKWKGYSESDATWEPEANLSCKQLIKEFLGNQEEEEEEEEYEVDEILETRKRKGVREFLIKWKGYSKSTATWEPETNLSCESLIKQFMSGR